MKKKFGKLTLTGRTKLKQFKRQGITVYEAKCECGKIKYFQKHNLVSGRTRSCGCVESRRKRKLVLFKGQYLTCHQIAKKIGLKSVGGVYRRIKRNISLERKYQERGEQENTDVWIAKKIGKSGQWVGRLKKDGYTKEEIIEKYKDESRR